MTHALLPSVRRQYLLQRPNFVRCRWASGHTNPDSNRSSVDWLQGLDMVPGLLPSCVFSREADPGRKMSTMLQSPKSFHWATVLPSNSGHRHALPVAQQLSFLIKLVVSHFPAPYDSSWMKPGYQCQLYMASWKMHHECRSVDLRIFHLTFHSPGPTLLPSSSEGLFW